jgi:hypothetical protein
MSLNGPHANARGAGFQPAVPAFVMRASRPDARNKTPAELYVASARRYPDRLPELEYPPGVHLRRISQQGSQKW